MSAASSNVEAILYAFTHGRSRACRCGFGLPSVLHCPCPDHLASVDMAEHGLRPDTDSGPVRIRCRSTPRRSLPQKSDRSSI